MSWKRIAMFCVAGYMLFILTQFLQPMNLMRYYGRLSASGAAFLDGVYFNYFGVRMGASFRF